MAIEGLFFSSLFFLIDRRFDSFDDDVQSKFPINSVVQPISVVINLA